MEKHTYADALRNRKETASRKLYEGIGKCPTVSDIENSNPSEPHVVIQSQAHGNDEPSVRIEEILTGEAIDVASEDPTPPPVSTDHGFLPEELYYLHQLLELYRRSMNTIHAWLAWEGYGSPGNTAQPTSRLLELAERAGWRDAMPSARELWALEVAIDCAKIFRMVEEEGEESKTGQSTSRTNAVAV